MSLISYFDFLNYSKKINFFGDNLLIMRIIPIYMYYAKKNSDSFFILLIYFIVHPHMLIKFLMPYLRNNFNNN